MLATVYVLTFVHRPRDAAEDRAGRGLHAIPSQNTQKICRRCVFPECSQSPSLKMGHAGFRTVLSH